MTTRMPSLTRIPIPQPPNPTTVLGIRNLQADSVGVAAVELLGVATSHDLRVQLQGLKF